LPKSRDSPTRLGECYAAIEYRGGRIIQRLGGNCNFPVTFAYLIYWWVTC